MTDGANIKGFFDQLLLPGIFKSFRMAIHPRKITIAFLAVASVGIVGWLMDLSEIVQGAQRGMFRSLYGSVSSQVHQAFFAMATLDIPGLIGSLAQILWSVGRLFQGHPLWSGIFFALVLIILSVAGGAICRLAALQFAEGERPGLVDSLRFSCRRFWHLFLAPLSPVVLVMLVGLFVVVLGLVGNIPYVGEIAVGLGMPLVLILGVFVTLLVVVTVSGFGLFFPAVAYEDTDCFIAVNNCFRYVFVRPWRYGLYCLAAGAYGMVTYYFIRIVAFGMLWTSYKFLQLGFLEQNTKLADLWTEPTFLTLVGEGFWQGPEGMGPTMWVGRFLVHLCCLSVLVLLVAYCVSFYFTANTIIYALLRKVVDGTELDKVGHETAVAGGPSQAQPQACTQQVADADGAGRQQERPQAGSEPG